MAKVKSPLFGLEAAGTIAKSVVFASWKGVRYARRHVVPTNPRTTAQVQTRSVFSFLNDLYKFLPSQAAEPWIAYAQGKPYTDRNGYIKVNLPLLRTATDLSSLVGSPGTNAAPPPSDLVLTVDTTNNTITAELQGSAPPGWTIDRATFMLIQDQDPHNALASQPVVQEAAASPYQVTFSGLADLTTYTVTAWFVFTKPNGEKAYGPSITKQGTT